MTTIDTDTRKGLILEIFKSRKYPDCSNGGISATVDEVTLVEIKYADGRVTLLPQHSRVFEAKPDRPEVRLVQRTMGSETLWHFEPVTPDGKDHWFMAGGAFCSTSDSRLHEITGRYGAHSLHDRREW